MSSFMSPVEIHAVMKAALFLLLFILLSSFRPGIHYSFHLLRGWAKHYNFHSLSSSNADFTLVEARIKALLVLIQIPITIATYTSQYISISLIWLGNTNYIFQYIMFNSKNM